MTRDRSLSILLMVLFGIASIAILTLAWLQPMPGSERIMATFIGVFGLVVAFGRLPRLKSPKVGIGAEQVMVNIEVEDKA